MPTVLRIGPFRFFFYSNENSEPPHIHVKAGDNEVKFWLDPILLASSYGFRGRELNQIERLIRENETLLKEAWDEYFDRD